MFKIYPNHEIKGYQTPYIEMNEDNIQNIVDSYLSTDSITKCCVVENRNNTDTVYGVYRKEDSKVKVKRR